VQAVLSALQSDTPQAAALEALAAASDALQQAAQLAVHALGQLRSEAQARLAPTQAWQGLHRGDALSLAMLAVREEAVWALLCLEVMHCAALPCLLLPPAYVACLLL
jgi:hypothetical protein